MARALPDAGDVAAMAAAVGGGAAGARARGTWRGAENIARYTGGRLNPVGELNDSPLPLSPGSPDPRVPLATTPRPPEGRVALLLHDDDLRPEMLPIGRAEVVAVGGVAVPELRSPCRVRGGCQRVGARGAGGWAGPGGAALSGCWPRWFRM